MRESQHRLLCQNIGTNLEVRIFLKSSYSKQQLKVKTESDGEHRHSHADANNDSVEKWRSENKKIARSLLSRWALRNGSESRIGLSLLLWMLLRRIFWKRSHMRRRRRRIHSSSSSYVDLQCSITLSQNQTRTEL